MPLPHVPERFRGFFSKQRTDAAGRTAVVLEKTLIPLALMDFVLLVLTCAFMFRAVILIAVLLLMLALHVVCFIAALKRLPVFLLTYFIINLALMLATLVLTVLRISFYMANGPIDDHNDGHNTPASDSAEGHPHGAWWLVAIVNFFFIGLLAVQIFTMVLAFITFRRLRALGNAGVVQGGQLQMEPDLADEEAPSGYSPVAGMQALAPHDSGSGQPTFVLPSQTAPDSAPAPLLRPL
eukprot:TRINITY_DN2801_c1_g2_i1.p1 TRINITY_DN2801_c1_g2~~TRINITY_DN2801_c1_g2_i1.p1  ORF type:complete len:238 (-),score=69.22 TRINITY_DN2801_c1_g2_i1:90-803(-)